MGSEQRGGAGVGTRGRVEEGQATLLALALVLAVPAAVDGANLSPQDMMSMMQGMSSMMKLWNSLSSGSNTDFSGMFSPRSAVDASSWVDPWGSAPWGSVPWSQFPGVSEGGGAAPWTSMPGVPGGGWPMPGAAPPGGGWPGAGGPRPAGPWAQPQRAVTPIEGRWEGVNGERLEFGGDRFRLAAADGAAIAGSFLVHGDRLVAYVPDGDVTRMYQYERRGEYLALKDESGQVLLFRRAP